MLAPRKTSADAYPPEIGRLQVIHIPGLCPNWSGTDQPSIASVAASLARRAELPIYVAETVLDKAKADDLRARDKEKLKKWLEEVDPDDLGKYTM